MGDCEEGSLVRSYSYQLPKVVRTGLPSHPDQPRAPKRNANVWAWGAVTLLAVASIRRYGLPLDNAPPLKRAQMFDLLRTRALALSVLDFLPFSRTKSVGGFWGLDSSVGVLVSEAPRRSWLPALERSSFCVSGPVGGDHGLGFPAKLAGGTLR